MPLPLRLGFFLEERKAGTARSDRPYRGIDRLPTPNSSDVLEGRDPLVWTRYFNALEDGNLNTSHRTAADLHEAFRLIGLETEIIYAEVSEIPSDWQLFKSRELWEETFSAVVPTLVGIHNRIETAPKAKYFLGIDISHPAPGFHSALRQPGLEEIVTDLDAVLNLNGLLDDDRAAERLLKVANQMDYGPLPFCGIRIWALDDEDGTQESPRNE